MASTTHPHAFHFATPVDSYWEASADPLGVETPAFSGSDSILIKNRKARVVYQVIPNVPYRIKDIAYFFQDPALSSMTYHLYGGHGLCMPWYGAMDGMNDMTEMPDAAKDLTTSRAAGWMALVETADDAAVRIPRQDGLLALAPVVAQAVAGMPIAAVHDVTCTWLGQRDVRTLENVDQLGWLFSQIEQVDRQEIGQQEFSVRWTGSVRAPSDGTYTFSICPLDLNYAHGGTFREQTMSIWVGDEQILDSTTGGWTSRATPVALSAAQPAPLRVELSYACTSQGVIDDRPAVAMLYWEGPGLEKQLVPASALTTPDGSHSGLSGAYVLKTAGQEENVTRVDAQINFIWFHQCFVVSQRDALRKSLADQLFAVAASAETLATWEQDEQSNPERWQAHWAFLEALDVARQQQWTAVLLAHPALVADCPNWAIANLYSRCRIGAPEESVAVVGLWAQTHADQGPVLDVDYFAANRGVYRELARKLGSQYAPHLEALQQEYLVLADGRCSLPVAYICAYGYWDQGRIEQWIDQLEARLANEELTGDARVNWLLARAQAEEIRTSPAYQYWFTQDRFVAGRGWIEEATLEAESEPARLRAFQELAGRLTVDEVVVPVSIEPQETGDNRTVADLRNDLQAAVDWDLRPRQPEFAQNLRTRVRKGHDHAGAKRATRK